MRRYHVILDSVRSKAGKIVPGRTKLNEQFNEQRKNLEEVFLIRFKKYEPELNRLYCDVRKKAEKFGVPVDELESKLFNSYQKTLLGIEKISHAIPFIGSYSFPDSLKGSGRKSPKKTAPKAKKVRKSTVKKTAKAENLNHSEKSKKSKPTAKASQKKVK